MIYLGTQQQDSTVNIPMPLRDASGAGVDPSATLEEADFDLHKDGNTTPLTLDASTITINELTEDGKFMVDIDLSNDADLSGNTSAGSQIQVWLTPNDETIDSQTVAECIAVFDIESDAEKGARRLRELYSSHEVGATGNTTTAVHLDGIGSQGDDELIGEVLLLFDVDGDEWHMARITDFADTGDLATVENLQGGALPFTPASGDYWFRVGHFTTDPTDVWEHILEDSNTVEEVLRGMAGVLLGKASGLSGTSPAYRDLGDNKDRVTATVDSDGNRSAITLDLS